MGSQSKVNVYSNRDKLSSVLAAYVARQAAGVAARRGRFCVALSGGSLMDIIGSPLATMPLSAAINWAAWHIFWADERWVPKNSPDSNYHHADRRFLTHVGIPVEQIHAADDSFDPAKTVEDTDPAIRRMGK